LLRGVKTIFTREARFRSGKDRARLGTAQDLAKPWPRLEDRLYSENTGHFQGIGKIFEALEAEERERGDLIHLKNRIPSDRRFGRESDFQQAALRELFLLKHLPTRHYLGCFLP
jgi:hypothetical protein